jgi:hypothetical protein
MHMKSFRNKPWQHPGLSTPFSSLAALGVTGTLAAAGVASSAVAATTPVEQQPSRDIGDRVAAIRDRLADPETASGLADRLRIERKDGLVQFANFNNWDNGWDNQGFNNY